MTTTNKFNAEKEMIEKYGITWKEAKAMTDEVRRQCGGSLEPEEIYRIACEAYDLKTRAASTTPTPSEPDPAAPIVDDTPPPPPVSASPAPPPPEEEQPEGQPEEQPVAEVDTHQICEKPMTPSMAVAAVVAPPVDEAREEESTLPTETEAERSAPTPLTTRKSATAARPSSRPTLCYIKTDSVTTGIFCCGL